ncbi:MAG: transketolase [Bacteroidota bacterium]
MPDDVRVTLQRQAAEIRKDIVRMTAAAGSSHVGSALSIVEILVALYFGVMRLDPRNPDWADRDRFILSKGHAATALYATLAARGFFPRTGLEGYYVNGGGLAGHPVRGGAPGIEASTGSLGHGLSIGVGMALAAKRDAKTHRVFVLLGDGECNEGSVWEATMCASHHGLDNLVIVVDRNGLQGLGRTDHVVRLDSLAEKWRAFACETREADGHDLEELLSVFETVPFAGGRPSVVIARTTKGMGVSFMENQLAWHYKSPDKEQTAQALREIEAHAHHLH